MAAVKEKIAVAIQLSERDVDSIVSSGLIDGDPETVIRKVGESLMRDLAGGGIMLSPQTVKSMEEAIGKEVDEDMIRDAFEKSLRSRSGRTIIEYTVDPARLSELEDRARTKNMSLHRMIQEWIEYALDQGWFSSVNPNLNGVKFSPEDYELLQQLLGEEHFHGSDIADWMRNRVESEADVDRIG